MLVGTTTSSSIPSDNITEVWRLLSDALSKVLYDGIFPGEKVSEGNIGGICWSFFFNFFFCSFFESNFDLEETINTALLMRTIYSIGKDILLKNDQYIFTTSIFSSFFFSKMFFSFFQEFSSLNANCQLLDCLTSITCQEKLNFVNKLKYFIQNLLSRKINRFETFGSSSGKSPTLFFSAPLLHK